MQIANTITMKANADMCYFHAFSSHEIGTKNKIGKYTFCDTTYLRITWALHTSIILTGFCTFLSSFGGRIQFSISINTDIELGETACCVKVYYLRSLVIICG